LQLLPLLLLLLLLSVLLSLVCLKKHEARLRHHCSPISTSTTSLCCCWGRGLRIRPPVELTPTALRCMRKRWVPKGSEIKVAPFEVFDTTVVIVVVSLVVGPIFSSGEASWR
jgi:hypothetical protein